MVEVPVLLWSQCGSVPCGERWKKNCNPSGQVWQNKTLRVAGEKSP